MRNNLDQFGREIDDSETFAHHQVHRDHQHHPNPNTKLQSHKPGSISERLSFAILSPSLFALTKLWSRLELHHIILLLHKQPIMRSVPTPILWIRMRIIGKTADTFVTSDSSKVSTVGMDDVKDTLR